MGVVVYVGKNRGKGRVAFVVEINTLVGRGNVLNAKTLRWAIVLYSR